MIRDPSHVRNYSIKDWVHFIEDAGFELTTLEKQTLKLDFDSWVQRMKTPEDQIKTLKYLQENAADVVKKYFNIQKTEVLKVRSDTLYLKNYPSNEF
ncbi:putative methyltransferase YcgJ [Acinetobacter baumannii]|nr:putative methyltransferase YcgJ [Acinetobacter baumannii]